MENQSSYKMRKIQKIHDDKAEIKNDEKEEITKEEKGKSK